MLSLSEMTNSQRASEYRVLVGFAVVHSLALWALFGATSWTMQRLWVGCVTLWFLWPVVLALHPGRSARRLVLSSTLLVLLMFPCFRMYDVMGPAVFGWPDGITMNP